MSASHRPWPLQLASMAHRLPVGTPSCARTSDTQLHATARSSASASVVTPMQVVQSTGSRGVERKNKAKPCGKAPAPLQGRLHTLNKQHLFQQKRDGVLVRQLGQHRSSPLKSDTQDRQLGPPSTAQFSRRAVESAASTREHQPGEAEEGGEAKRATRHRGRQQQHQARTRIGSAARPASQAPSLSPEPISAAGSAGRKPTGRPRSVRLYFGPLPSYFGPDWCASTHPQTVSGWRQERTRDDNGNRGRLIGRADDDACAHCWTARGDGRRAADRRQE